MTALLLRLYKLYFRFVRLYQNAV